MTLVAFRLEDDRATVLTDTLVYSDGMCDFWHVTKVHLLPHVDGVFMTRGAGELGPAVQNVIDHAAQLIGHSQGAVTVVDVDALDQVLEQLLPEVWGTIDSAGAEGTRETGWVYLIGWSDTHGRFRAFEYCSERNFTSLEHSGRAVITFPPRQDVRPDTDDEWARLGLEQYQRHSLASAASGDKLFIGGDLVLTRLERGWATQRRIYTIPIDDANWRRAMIGTGSRLGQMGPCICGSGRPQAFCHIRWQPTDPCPCGTPDAGTFLSCHLVRGEAVAEHWLKHGDEFRALSAELAAAFRVAGW